MFTSLRNYIRVDETVRKRFKCLRCGRCCSELIVGPISTRDMARIVKLNDKHLSYFKNYLRFSREGNILMSFKIIANKDGEAPGCAFFDPAKKECKIYKYRPKICRMFPFRTKTLVWKNCEWVRRNLRHNNKNTKRKISCA